MALAVGILLAIAAAALWLEGPWQHPSGSRQPTSCRLPVYLTASNRGGFLSVPGYVFSEAPAGTFMDAPKAADHHWSYDASTARWLPVDHRMISADGNWWVYATPPALSMAPSAAVHLVDRHGSERTVWTGTGRAYPLGWTAEGAVFVHVATLPQFETEYLLVDPVAGKLRSLTPIDGDPVGVDASGLWGIRNLFAGAESDTALHATLLRTSLNSGATITWWDRTTSALILVLGFDKDQRPILGLVPTNGDPERYLALASPNVETEITGDARAVDFQPATALGDSRGIWFGDSRGAVWFWKAGLGLQRVAQLPTQGTDSVDVAVIAGPCG